MIYNRDASFEKRLFEITGEICNIGYLLNFCFYFLCARNHIPVVVTARGVRARADVRSCNDIKCM